MENLGIRGLRISDLGSRDSGRCGFWVGVGDLGYKIALVVKDTGKGSQEHGSEAC